ncbi:MAG TPA: hypothetical protein VN768_03690 [Acidimicrobiales bacterium]|nr:hypothetical protein [Acidimicrobiales bacterium]
MKSKILGLGLGLAISALGVVAVPSMASADSTCYTGCTGPVTGVSTPITTPVTTPAAAPIEPKQATTAGLALTGADIEGMATIGAGALVVGGLMVRRSRRLRRVAA